MTHPQTGSHLLRMVAAGLRHVAGAAAGFLTIPLVAHGLGAERLGAWALVGTSAFFVGLSDVGLGVTIQRALLEGDTARARRMVGLSMASVTVLALPMALLLFLLLDVPGADAPLAAELRTSGAVALLAGVVGAYRLAFHSYLLARAGRVAVLAWARGAASLVQVAATAALLWWSPTLLAPAVGLLLGNAVELAVTVAAARHDDPELPRWPALVARDELGAALRAGAAVTTMNLGALLALRADLFLLAQWAPLAVVAAYAVAARVVDQVVTLAKQSSTALLPFLGRGTEREGAVRLGTLVFGGFVASTMLALVLLGRPLLIAWAGDAATLPEAAIALCLLGAAAVFTSAHELLASALMLGGRSAWRAATPQIVGHSANIAVTVALVPFVGVWAAASGTLLGSILTATLVVRRARTDLAYDARSLRALFAPMGRAAVAAALVGAVLAPWVAGHVAASIVAATVATGAGLIAAAAPARRFA